MNPTPRRLAFLRQAAAGDPNTGNTNSSVLTDLINAHLIECVGLDYRLTPAGVSLLREWEMDTAAITELATALAHVPGVTVERARTLSNCICSTPNVGFQIELRYPDVESRYRDGVTVTRRVAFQATSQGAEAYARRLTSEHPEAPISITAVPNPYYRPNCLGDIRPGTLCVEHTDESGTPRTYCPECAISLWAERDIRDDV